MTKKLSKKDLDLIASGRNHTIISFENYQNVHSQIEIHCNTCNTTFVTTVHSYKNAKKTGCPECKKQVSSQTHKGKVTSEETKRKIGAKASRRPGSLKGKTGALHPRSKGGLARDLKNPSSFDYMWKTAVRQRCKYTCVVSLENNKQRQKGFVCHHLNSHTSHEDLRYLPENGVYLKRAIHKQFHDIYGYGNNTELQFTDFCRIYHCFDWFERKKELYLL